ncbi:Uncharacterised protein [Mycobacterium tuberculosis]|nr:Uncharacterised protein [Mycobacterium tuberculosis]CKW91201.1 Uncharacterised protein [Mycobacterium tuberculosis]CNU99324.1 Uncharacterised protein [Mycobacterium tuberculosis]
MPAIIARPVALARVSSSTTVVNASSLTTNCGRAARAWAACRFPAAVGSRCTSASILGVSGPSASMAPAVASAVTIRQRRSVSTAKPANPHAAGSPSSNAPRVCTCRGDNTDEHSELI